MTTTVQEDQLATADLAGVARGDQQPEEEPHPLFPENVANEFRSNWDRIQTGFVDEPRKAVQQADELVAQAIKRLADSFSEERNRLERQWDRGDEVSTEDLRVALQRYRSFFQRLMAI